MIHRLTMNLAVFLVVGQCMRVLSDLEVVRDNRDCCFLVGIAIHFCYLAAAISLAFLSVYTLLALAHGLIGGFVTTSLLFSVGVSLVVVGFNIAAHFDLMGLDPR